MTTVTEIPTTGSTLVSAREVPWMKLGKLVDNPLTAVEAAEQGGLNFEVVAYPIGFNTGHLGTDNKWVPGEWNTISGRNAIVRKDTGMPLGIMSSTYEMLQFGEAFNFMDTISPTYVAAGILKGGKQGFMVVKAPDILINVLGADDPHDLYVVLRTSHDGSRAVEASVMPLRHRCMNQLTLATFTKGVKSRWTVKHTTTMHAKLAEAQVTIANLGEYGKAYEKLVDRLAAMKVSDDRALTALKFVLPQRPRRDEQIEKITTAWHGSPTVGFDYTGWGLINAVSEYFDWTRAGGSPESRFVGALQGSTHRTINKTVKFLLTV